SALGQKQTSRHLQPMEKATQQKRDIWYYFFFRISFSLWRHISSKTVANPLAAGVSSLSRSHIKPTSRLSRGLTSFRTDRSLPRSPAMAPDGTMAMPTPARTKLIIVVNWVTVATWRSVSPADEAAPSIVRRVRDSCGRDTS